MGQEEALKILKEVGDWITVKELIEKYEFSRTTLEEALRKLYKHGEVLRKQIKVNRRMTNLWRTKC